MKNLLFWNQVVGFTITELADLFSVSPSFLARLIRGKKSLPVQIIRKMIDPLFEHFENEDLEIGLKKWHNPNPEIRAEKWGIKLIALQLKLDKALKNKTLQEKQYWKNGLILHQFKRKESIWLGQIKVVYKSIDKSNGVVFFYAVFHVSH